MSRRSDDYKWFAGMADPHAWLLVADNLHEQAILLQGQRGRSRLIRTDQFGNQSVWDNVDRSVFLLAGFALENALKAFLVFENPSWVSNGSLAKPLRSHSLLELRSLSKLVPYRTKYAWVLVAFEEGLESWARYPCALSVDETDDQDSLTDELWQQYLFLMRAYGKRLCELISKGWKGPHGCFGTWEMRGDYLAMTPSNRESSFPGRFRP